VIVRGAVVALVAAGLCASKAGATTFTDAFRGPMRALGRALSDTVARSLPVTSASPGITFTYDPASGSFQRDTDLLGQLYLERARPIGRGKWNLTLSYQRVSIDAVQGESLDSLQDDREPIVVIGRPRQQIPPPPRGAIPIKVDRFDVGLTVNEVTLAATYGITENLDVNLTLPILVSSLSIDAAGRVFKVNPNTGGLIFIGNDVAAGLFQDFSSSATGVGDLFLRGKYRLLAGAWGDLAPGLVLRMPTGNQDNFQGTGDWEISPLLYASSPRWPVGHEVSVQGFFNGGLDLDATDVSRSEGRFGVGVDVALASRATLSIAFLGREPFDAFAPTGFFNVPRYRRANDTCDPSGRTTRGCPTAPLFGLETERPSYYSLSIGGRVNLWRDTVFGFANVLIPLLDEGIHTDPIPLVGFEATF
jgi:hypothetical protein